MISNLSYVQIIEIYYTYIYIYMNDTGASDKIVRWKLMPQEFDFEAAHIPGDHHVVDDLDSRLCVTATGREGYTETDLGLQENEQATIPFSRFNTARVICVSLSSGRKKGHG